MALDYELVLSENQDLSQAQGAYYSTKALDLSVVRDIGKGNPLYLVIVVDEAFDSSGGAATVVFSLISNDSTTLSSSPTTILSTPALGEAVLTQGRAPIVIPIPMGIAEQYIGVMYTIGGETTTAGTVSAFIAMEYQNNI